jgi:N,N-dimethylformamidase
LEVRRSEGVRTWDAAPGERRHEADGKPGGLWRSLGRTPNALFGVGFSALGYSGDGAYALATSLSLDSLPNALRQVCAELKGRLFGVAGMELDAVSADLGSPAGALVIAEVVDLPAGYVPAIEELVSLDSLLPNAQAALSRVRGHIALTPLPGGGLCFAAASIRWASGLLRPGDPTRVSVMTGAALKDAMDAAALARFGQPDSAAVTK